MEKDIATASETENIDIDIATDSEMENVEAPVFGADDTVYYAIAKNPTNTSAKILYFSSTDLSTNTSIGEIEKSGIVQYYTYAGNRPWGSGYSYSLQDVIILDEIKPTSMRYWFYELYNAKFDGFDKINTSNVISTYRMFENLRTEFSSTNIEHMKNWDVGNVTDMSYMFSGYQGTTLDLSGWNTSKVTDMSFMFYCYYGSSSNKGKLTSLDVSNWDTRNVTNMRSMFDGLENLTYLDLSTWNTSKVENMSYMFEECQNLGTLNLTGSFNTSNVTEMHSMFSRCLSLTSLDLSNFNTAKVTDMNSTFYNCQALTSLNVSSFNTKEVTTTYDMFRGCSSLTELKLGGFDTAKVTIMFQMFAGCTNLKTIYVSTKFVTTNVTDSGDGMFHGCTSLTGGNGTHYSKNKIDKTYARIDGAWPDQGYFTLMPILPVEILTIAGLPNPSGEGDHIWPAGVFTALDLSNFAINVKYDDNSEKDVNYTGNETDFSFAPAPLATTSTSLVITYKNIKATVSDIFVYEQSYAKDITSIGGNVTTVYVPGDTFNPIGLELEVKTFGGDTTTISYNDDTKDKFIFSPNPFAIPPETITDTTTTITVQYGEYGGCTYDIPIIVTKRAQGVEIEGGIDKYYTVGDIFDTTHIHNLVATATNADNTVEVIKYAEHPEYFSFTPNLGTALTVNDNKITIKIKGIEKDYPIVVEPEASELQSIAVVTGSVKTNYVENQLFDPTGLKITTTYTGNVTRTIEYNEETKNNFTFSPDPFAATPEKLTYGIDKVTITYKTTKSCDLSVTVRLRQVATISQVTGLVGTAGSTAPAFIASGSNIDLTTLQVTIGYDNGEVETKGCDGNEVKFLPEGPANPKATYKIETRGYEKVLGQDIIFVYTDTDMKEITGVTKQPTIVYVPGEPFDPTGLEIQTKDFDNNPQIIRFDDTVKDNFIFSPNPFAIPPETITETTTTITVQYGEYGGCTYDIPIIVTKRAQGVEIEGGIDQYYTVGDTFDTTHIHNLVATATNADNTVEVIKYADNPEYFSFTPNLGTALTVNDNKITIKIKGIEKDYPIVVEPEASELQSIAVVTGSVKTDYVENQLFDPTGLKITTTYTGNVTRTIEYNEETKNNFTFSPDPFAATPEKLTYGIDKVTITYKTTKSCDLSVTVRLRQVATISQATGLVGTAGSTAPAFIASGSNIDLTTLQVTIGYDNGEVETKGCDGNEVKFLPEGPANPKATYKIETRGYEKVLGQDIIFVYTTEDKKEITGVTKQPTTTVYIPGEPFNPTGMEIQTKDFEGNTETIICTGENKDDFTIEPDPIPNNATDPTDIIVRYKDYEECKTTITVKVTPPAASLEVGGRIDKYYTVGDTFEATNIHDLVATATNADNTVEVIKYAEHPEYFSFTPAFGKVFSLADNNSKIVVKVKGQQKEYDVVVLPNENPSEAPTIAHPPTKTQYVEDEPFDPTGLEITVKYPNGETRTIEFTEETKNDFTFSPNPFAVPQETIQRGTTEITIIYKGQTFTTPIDVTEKQVVEILSVIGLDGTAGSTATAFIASGSDINLTNLQVKVKYDNNQEATINYDNNEIKFEPLGKADPNATYKIKARAKEKVLGQDIIFVYTTEDKKEITGVTKQPTTTVYIPGEHFNPTGMEIQTKDFEGNTETIICTEDNKDDFTFEPDPIPNDATDPTDIIVRYKDYEECKTTITVKVTPPAASLEVGGRIDKYYTVGDTFEATNIHDLVATATNADNTVEVIKYADNPEYFSFTPAFGKVFSLTDNNSKIVVKVKGQQKEYDIVVLPATSELESIALVTGSVKTNYIENQLFDPTGLKITATYTGNVTRTIEYAEENKNEFTFSPNPFAATPEKLVYGTDHVDITYNGKSTSVNVSVALRQVVDIKEVTGLPGQTATEPAFIKNGATIDLTNLQVKVEYNNGEEEIKSYNATSTEVQLLPTGPADATAVYKIKVRDYEEALDQSVIFVYTDEDKKEITGISSQPTTVYVPGETFDPTGLEINTKDFEGNTETITFDDTVKDNFTFSPNPFAAPPETIAEGTTTIKVQYGNYEKSTIEIPITLLAKASLFTVNDAAIDKYYRVGDTFATTNIHNLVATVINTDATQETIKYTEHPEYFSFTPAIGTAFKVNDTKIIIKLRGVTCDYPIVVEPAENPTGATAGKLPTKTQYEDGEPFDPTGMIITVTYPGGVTRTIEYNDETKDDFTFSPNPFAVPPETLSSGNSQVEVKYRDKPFYVPVTIRKKMQSIAVKQGPTNKEYSVGDKFDPTGLVIEVTYTDTTTETIVYNSSTQSGFTFVPALDQAFTSTADKVTVKFGTVAPIDIDGLVIHKESISITIVNSDGTTTVVTDVTRDEFEKKLDEAIAKGAIGFHEYTADGINDAQKRYNRYTPPTMNKEQALDKFDDYIASGTGKMFIGASFPIPAPAPTPSRERGGSDGGGRSIITYDPQGNIQPGQQQEINKENNIPQSSLVKNDALAETLKSLAENVNRPIVNVKDESGDKGYGQWLHVPNTIIWMVMSGESTNTTKQEGNAGFLSNGWYNLSWKGRDEWYHFDKNGMMQLGWITENSKIYYLEEDLNSNWYGRRVTGPYTVKGVRYIFDQTGALIQ